MTPNSIATAEALALDLDATRTRGYAVDNQESSLDVICVAAALSDAQGVVVGGMSISAPSSRMNREREQQLATMLIGTVAELGARLGYRTNGNPERA